MADARDLESPIWAKWQEGTRHHWAWCCPHCDEWFIPRTGLLKCADGASPAEARRHTWLVCKGLIKASKGYGKRSTPISMSNQALTPKGQRATYGIQLALLDSDFFKSFVHERLNWPEEEPGAFHLSQDSTDAYLKQLVSEVRIVNDSGRAEWIQRSRDNHFLDAEALAAAAGHIIGVQRIRDGQLSERSIDVAQHTALRVDGASQTQ